LGLLTGVAVAGIAASDCDGAVFSASDCFLVGSVVLGPAGALLGALIGHAIRRESWREIRLPERAGIMLDPRGGAGLSLPIAF
jgi:hypothetical protein